MWVLLALFYLPFISEMKVSSTQLHTLLLFCFSSISILVSQEKSFIDRQSATNMEFIGGRAEEENYSSYLLPRVVSQMKSATERQVQTWP